MTPQEAIKYIEQHNHIADDVKDMCIEALEKQIPKKPTGLSVNENNMRIGNCSCCKILVSDLYDKHHCLCGQALDWS